ncbi:hypothetical protein L6R46_26495 [Myxococcota bacterium]|jgi:hypothetical protein|nr:hypothetical protein [Myxococcota bacterium]
MTIRNLFVLIMALGFSSSTALAQDPASQGEVVSGSSTSSSQKIQFGRDAITDMKETAEYVNGLLVAAQPEQDAVKIQCLNKKLSAVRALVQVSESALASMQEALSVGDDARADYEFRKIGVAKNKAVQFRGEADACVGEEGKAETQESAQYEGAELSETIADGNAGIGIDPPGVSPFE